MIESATTPVSKGAAHPVVTYVCKGGLILLWVGGLAAAGLAFVYPLLGSAPFWGIWEDSLMLVRYADNLLRGWGLVWNPGGEATYGLTSLFYIAPVALVQSIVPHKPLISLAATSFLCGCLFLVLMGMLLRPFWRTDRAVKTAIGVMLLITFARVSTGISIHFWSGMDTMFVLSMITGYFLIARWQQRASTWTPTIVMGIAGGLIYGVRPDLLIYTFLIPATSALLSKPGPTRVRSWAVLAITTVTAAVLLAWLYFYFGSPLPLSFYAKGLTLYGDFEYEHYRQVPYQQFIAYVSSCCLLIGAIFVDLLDWAESRTKVFRSSFEVALLCGTAVYCLYYLFFVLQIMEFSARFYYPTLPALVWLGVHSTQRLAAKYWPSLQSLYRQGTGWGWTAVFLTAGSLMIARPLLVNARQIASVPSKGFANWNQITEYRAYWHDYWFRLDRFSELPDDLTMATSEIGHPGAMNSGKVVVDMAGLNERQFAKHPFSAPALFRTYSPDLIFMPHPGYRSMNRELLANPVFQRDYEYFPAADLGAHVLMGLALRRDSRHYQRMRSIVKAPE